MESILARIFELTQESNNDSALEQIKALLKDSGPAQKLPSGKKKIPVSIDASGGGEYSVFGPTSAFLNLVDTSQRSVPTQLFNNGLMNMSQLVVCLENFFKWMYPDVTVFIHRESFLDEFLTPGRSQGYCSEELVYAIAALGAKCSPSEDLRILAPNFFETARNKILTTRICLPQINTLQALLCLSLYELGEGNASASWMFSGMAIRMGYDLGFQLDPKDWSLDSASSGGTQQTLITNINVMVRSRIYWGCYIMDHFVSLIMGRPVTVRKTEASIPTSEVLPNATNIDGYIFQPAQSAQSVRNLDAFQTIEPLCLLSECIGSLLTDIYTGESTDESLSYLNKMKLAKYNGFLANWRRKLPVFLRWTDSTLKKQDYNPTVVNYRLFYYIVVICLNRPFLNVQTDVFLDQSPQDILDTAVSELSVCLRKFNESGVPASILIVYSSILGLSISLMQLQGISEDFSIAESKIHDLKVYYTTVSNACAHWKLATKSLIFVKKKVTDIHHPAVTAIFDSVAEIFENKLSDDDFPDIMDHGDDIPYWTNQDNLFANFFDFVDHT
ncbi:hypothetical protein JCM33374_g4259 [Metschnikowia sp. JCM 33374]|nr:hypothetical protein JCM33374_g4259 [Metschnikowia sp. JCM 33374]